MFTAPPGPCPVSPLGRRCSLTAAFSRGADQTIDYTTTRFEDVLRDIDVVLDAVGGDTVARSWPELRPGGAAKLIDTGWLKAMVANVFPLTHARHAFELAAHGHIRGKIVLSGARRRVVTAKVCPSTRTRVEQHLLSEVYAW
jgi:NADPH:quinone reductase-like Zn-dependent oxidoreductase